MGEAPRPARTALRAEPGQTGGQTSMTTSEVGIEQQA